MSSLILPRRFREQPQERGELDLINPLNDRNTVAINLGADTWGANNPYNFGYTDYAGRGIVGSERGSTFNGTNQRIQSRAIALYNVAGPATFVFRLATVTDSGGTLFALNSGTTTKLFAFFIGNGATSTLTDEIITIANVDNNVPQFGGNLGWCSSDRSLFDGRIHTLQMTTTGSEWRLWFDGVQQTITAASGATNNGKLGPFTEAALTTTIGARDIASGTFSYFFNGGISFFKFDNRDLSAYAKEIADNPWKVFKAKSRVLYFDVGGGAITLTAANASSATSTTAGAITQTHLLASANASSATAATTGAITQTHILSAANASSATSATAGAISVAGEVTCSASNASSATSTTTGAISQTHILASANASTATTATSGAITVGAVISFTSANITSATSTTSGAIGQTHILGASNALSATLGSTAQITQTHVLLAANASSATAVTGGAITVSAPGTGTLTPETIAAIADAVWAHSSAVQIEQRLTEAWGRLGLDPANPLISGQTEISFGSIVMALTGNETSSTLTRAP